MTEDETHRVVERLDVLVRLVALAQLEEKTRGEQIALLSHAGMQPKEIGAIVGTSPNAVSVELSKQRRRARGT